MSNSHYRLQTSSSIVDDTQKDLNFNLNENKVVMSQSENILCKSTNTSTVSSTIGSSSKLLLTPSGINTLLGNSSPIHRQVQFIQNPTSNAAIASTSSSTNSLTSTISSVNMPGSIFSSSSLSNTNHKQLVSTELTFTNQRQISSSNIASTKDNLSNTISISSINTLIPNDNTLTSIPKISITNDDVHTKTGAKESFYGKGKQYCSPGCVQEEISDVKNKNSFVKLLKYSDSMITLVTNSPSNSSISYLSTPQQPSDGNTQFNVPEQTEPIKKVCSTNTPYKVGGLNSNIPNQKLINSKQFAHQQTSGAIEHSLVSAPQSPLSSSRRRNPLTFGNFSQSQTLQQIGQQSQSQIGPQRFQLTSNGNVVINLNSNQANCILPNQQQQTITTIVPPKRTKKNNQPHQNGQNLMTTGTSTVKRVRSKVNLSLPSPLMSDVNYELMSNQYLKSIPSTCTSTSSNSILVNQLKKPPVVGINTTNSVSPETATLTSNQPISTNSSLLLHLTSPNSSADSSITSSNQLQLFPQKNFFVPPVTNSNTNNSISNSNNNFLQFNQPTKQMNQSEFVQVQIEQSTISNNTNTDVDVKPIQNDNKCGPNIESQDETFVENDIPVSSTPSPTSIIEKIKELDSHFDATLTADVIDRTQNGNFSKYPPVWWLIFEKFSHNHCAPVWAFPNIPLNQQWQKLFPNSVTNVYVEIRLSTQDLQQQTNGTLLDSNSPTTNTNLLTSNKVKFKKNSFSSEEMDKFWFAKIIGHSG